MAPIPQPLPTSSATYRIHLEDLTSSGTQSLCQLSNLGTLIQSATNQCFIHLYTYYGTPQACRSITLFVESLDGVAETNGSRLDSLHKEIHMSQEYIAKYTADKSRFESECNGVVVHEMVHCWQHDCEGTAPSGLVEGIADYVRLKAGLAPPHWKRETKSDLGDNWDDGYQKTAWFLEWLEGDTQFGVGTVSKINDYMDGREYEETSFWEGVLGESVETLWEKYLKNWDDEHPSTTTSRIQRHRRKKSREESNDEVQQEEEETEGDAEASKKQKKAELTGEQKAAVDGVLDELRLRMVFQA